MAGTAKPRKASHDNGSWGLYLIWALSAASLWCCWQSEYVLTFGYRSVPILFNMTLPFVSVACYVVVIFSLPTIVNRCGSYRGVRTHVEANFPHSAKRGQKVVIELNNGSELEFKVLSNWQPGVATEKPVKDASKPKTQDPNAVVAVRSVKSCEVEGGMSPSAFTVIVDKAPLINPEVFRIVDAMWNFFLCWLSVVMLFGVLISVGLRMHENGTFNPWTFFCDEVGWAHDQPENRPSASAEELWMGENVRSNLRPGPVNFFAFVFCASKYMELLDTVLQILKRPRRSVILLHWYHHCTVLLFTWFTGGWGTTFGLVFVAINAMVHSFMYYFYFRGALGGRISWAKSLTMIQVSSFMYRYILRESCSQFDSLPLTSLTIFLTMIQMTQMVAGIAVGVSISVKWYIHYYGAKKDLPLAQRDPMCRSKRPETMVICCIIMYGSYLWLFFHMYAQKYYKVSGLELIFGTKSSSSVCGTDPTARAPINEDTDPLTPKDKQS
jgi:hypothetical protein